MNTKLPAWLRTLAVGRNRTRIGPEARGSTPATVPVQAIGWMLAGFLGAVALNLHHTALWCAPLALAAAAWRARAWRRRPRMPSGLLRIVVVVVLTLAALLDFRTGGSLGAAASLLVVMAALKLSETAQRRDWLIVMSAALFLLLAACLDAQALWRLPLYAAELWLLCTALYALGGGSGVAGGSRSGASSASGSGAASGAGDASATGDDAGGTTRAAALLATSARSLAAALPLAVLLFLFFPRLPGAFWALPEGNQASTGLGDEMSPGSIVHLYQSDAPALRVRFDGPLPPPEQRYWRGPVLHYFDGYTWRRQPMPLGAPAPLRYDGPAYHYQVTLEPDEHNVLIALEMPRAPPVGVPAFSTYDYQLLTRRPVLRAISYSLVSSPQHHNAGPLPPLVRQMDLWLPRTRNPRSRQLAQQLRAGAADDAAFVTATLDYLRHGGFSYTLTPPPLGLNSVDDLLFYTRQGFCEHYASAFAMLMRAGGVPARVVTGYLGGEWNPFGDYLLIRQSDAHAWDEVWLQGRGWVRVDPTSVVSPASLTEQLDGLQPAAGAAAHVRAASWLLSSVQAWQAVNAWWQDQVIGFNFTQQLNLIGRLGFGGAQWQALVWLLGIGGALWLALVAWSLRPRTWVRADPLSRSWRRLERKLGHSVAPRASYEGPVAYAERVGRARPELAASLGALARRYARLRYGPGASPAELQRFRRAVKLWRPRTRRTRPRK
jgi:transglutaminase-like putative cysteine protease